MAIKNETSSQNTSTPATFDRKADKRPDLGTYGGGEQERTPVTRTISESAGVNPNDTDVPTSNQEGDDMDTVAGKRTAAGSAEE